MHFIIVELSTVLPYRNYNYLSYLVDLTFVNLMTGALNSIGFNTINNYLILIDKQWT